MILDEISMHADDPAELAVEAVAAEIFGKSGLGRPVIGSAASVADLTRRRIMQHWRRHYHPGGLVVAAAGKVDHDRLVERLSALDDRPSKPAAPRRGPLRSAARRAAHATDCRSSNPALCWRSPAQASRCSPISAWLLSLIIGGGMSSRLFVEIRERRGLTSASTRARRPIPMPVCGAWSGSVHPAS